MPEQTMKSLPLQGLRILNTRAQHQASAFSARLNALGAIPVEFPTIRIVAPEDWAPLDHALKRLCESRCYDWLVFTSANGVRSCFDRLVNIGYSPASLDNVRIAAIGPATATTLRRCGARVDLVPSSYIAEAVADSIIHDMLRRGEELEGKNVLLARAEDARHVLILELQSVGIAVDVVAAYRTMGVDKEDQQGQIILRQLKAQELDILTFTSSSTVRNFIHWLTEYDSQFADMFIHHLVESGQPKIACIGPITSLTAQDCGLKVHIEAQEYTIAGLVEAMIRNEEKE